MPLPRPSENESRDTFISRCMGNDTMNNDFPDNDQRMAVCQRQWEDRNKGGNSMPISRKTFTTEVKLDEQGQFEAVFATLETVDHDGDVIMKGSIEEGSKVRISAYNHSSWGGALPVGKGTVHEEENELKVRGQFFIDTESGNETYKVLKNLDDLTEWSFGFDRVEEETGEWEGKQVNLLKKMKVYEVSPVLLGAGIGTRTTVMKNKNNKGAVRNHETAVVDEAWSAGKNVTRLSNDASASVYRNTFAWEPEAQEDKEDKSKWKLPHHEVDSNGNPGAANYRGCIAVIAALNGARGGVDIPSDDRQGVFEHVAKHIRDHGEEPPELKADDAEHLTLAAHAAVVAEELRGLTERLQEIAEQRRDQKRKIGDRSARMLTITRTEIIRAEEACKNLFGQAERDETAVLQLIKTRLEVNTWD